MLDIALVNRTKLNKYAKLARRLRLQQHFTHLKNQTLNQGATPDPDSGGNLPIL